MKKDAFITLLLAIILVIGVTILKKENKKENNEESYFFVETPIERYSPLMSSVKGFPFIIKCNNNQTVIVEITNGTLHDETGTLKENKSPCNKTIYWNEKEVVNEVKIKFHSDDKLLENQEFTLLKNEKQEFYLAK